MFIRPRPDSDLAVRIVGQRQWQCLGEGGQSDFVFVPFVRYPALMIYQASRNRRAADRSNVAVISDTTGCLE